MAVMATGWPVGCRALFRLGPHGRPMTLSERIDDMLARHGEASPNARAHAKRGPYIVEAARGVASRLETAGVGRKAHRIF